MAAAFQQLIRRGEGAVLGLAAQHLPSQAANIRAVARAFGVPISAVARDPEHFEKRIRVRQAAAAFRAAPAVRAWIAETPYNLARAAGQIPQLVYLENTARHAAASVTHAGAAAIGGYGHLADAYHRIHRAIDPISIVSGHDLTVEGLDLQSYREAQIAALPPTDRAKARLGPELTYAEGTKPWADEGKAWARRIDIDHPDRVQRFVGNAAGVVPGLGAALLNPALGAAVFASQGADAAYDDAIAHHASPQTAQKAAAVNGVIDGALTFIPGEKLLGRYVPAAGNAALNTARSYLNKGLATAGLTTSMTVAENAVAKGFGFDPNRPLLAGGGESFVDGALLGWLMPGGRRSPSSPEVRPDRPSPPPPPPSPPRPLDLAVDAARGARLVRTAPDHAAPLLRKIVPHARVRIPVQPVQDYVATLPPQEAARFLTETGIGPQLPADTALPRHIEIDLPTYLGVLARDEGPGAFPGAHEAIADHAEMVAGAPVSRVGGETSGVAIPPTEPAPDTAPNLAAINANALSPNMPPQVAEAAVEVVELPAADAHSAAASAASVPILQPPLAEPASSPSSPADAPAPMTSEAASAQAPEPFSAELAVNPSDDPYAGLSFQAKVQVLHELIRSGITGNGPDFRRIPTPASRLEDRIDPPTVAPDGRTSRLRYVGGTPDKFSPTGRSVVERMRDEGRIEGDGPLLRGNPNNLRLIHPDGSTSIIDETIDMAHKIDAVVWWNEVGHFLGPKVPEVRRFMLDSSNYELQLSSINRSRGAKIGQNYQLPILPDLTEPEE